MSNDMNEVIDLLNVLRGTTERQLEAMKLADVMTGTVLDTDPLKIRVSDRLTLTEEFLLLSTMVVDYNVYMTVDHLTEKRELHGRGDPDYENHDHEYKGKKRFFVHNGLKVGEKVVLLRLAGGRKFYVMDRVRYGNEDDSD